MRLDFYTILCFYVFCFPALVGATTVMAVRTPTDVYVGADSRVKTVRLDGSFLYEQQCKIGQAAKVFFAAAGPYSVKAGRRDPTSGLDIRALLIEAQTKPAGGIRESIAWFDKLFATAMARSWESVRKSSRKAYEELISRSVYIYLFALEGDTPVAFQRQFTGENSGAAGTTIHLNKGDCPPGCAEIDMIGVGYGDVFKNSRAALKTREQLELIREAIEASIKADPEQSAPPVDILHITKNGAKWIQKKDQCPEIQP